jgi:hypothetical protein
LLLTATAGACACGIALDATVERERALVIERPGREEIVASFDLSSDGGGRAAVVLPVPGDPVIGAIERGDPLAYLDAATTIARAPAGGGDVGAAPPTGAVDVIGRETVGGYDVARLRADDPRALDEWLGENGYSLPEGAERILSGYVEEGWRYVAIRLAPGSDGRLKPLRISFPAEQIVYPMRLTQLGSDPVNLTLYVLADGRRSVERLHVRYDGPVSELDPPVPAELRGLLAAAPYLTRLEATAVEPGMFTEDLEILDGDDGHPAWPVLVAAAALLGGLALLVRARLR